MSQVTSFARALRRLADSAGVSVPGAPRTLRLEDVDEAGRRLLRASWSFVDPESYEGDGPEERRLGGAELYDVPSTGQPDDCAARWWEAVQLAAALRYKHAVDADWVPGQAPEPERRSETELWQALLDHLRHDGSTILRAEPGDLRVQDRDGTLLVFAITPAEWAAYLSPPLDAESREEGAVDRSPIVPAGTRQVDGLPQWVDDELFEVIATRGSPIRIVGGSLEGEVRFEDDLGHR